MFYEKCFRFLKKSNASEFASASSFFLQSASASPKIQPLPHPYLKLSNDSASSEDFGMDVKGAKYSYNFIT